MDLTIKTESDYSDYLNLIEKGEEIEILRWEIRGREIPSLPNSLKELYCNQLTALPPLPTTLKSFVVIQINLLYYLLSRLV